MSAELAAPTPASRPAAPPLLPMLAFAVLVVLAVFGPWITPFDALKINAGPFNAPPSWTHLFGTDHLGRDLFSRVIAGARTSVFIGAAATLVALALGGLVGILAVVTPRLVGEAIMRLVDVVMSLPGILLAIVFATAFGGGAVTTVVAISIIFAPAVARMVRGALMTELEEEYVVAARLFGTSTVRLLRHHIAINIAIPILVFATVICADAIVLEGALSFIGVGVPPPTPSWGNILADGRRLVLSGSWWITTFSGLAIFLSVLVLNRMADWLNKRFDTGQ